MKVAKATVSYNDVINFFESADLDLANLTHQLATAKLNERIEKRQATGERLKKARAARKPKGSGDSSVAEIPATPAPTEAVEQAEQPRQPGRPRAVSA